MAIVFVGIDLAKNVFAVHGVNEAGRPELVRPTVPRARLQELIATLAPCTIGMEACSGAHHWARQFEALGHTVRLMAPKFVAPYRMKPRACSSGWWDWPAAAATRRRWWPSPTSTRG
jgi:transposase